MSWEEFDYYERKFHQEEDFINPADELQPFCYVLFAETAKPERIERLPLSPAQEARMAMLGDYTPRAFQLQYSEEVEKVRQRLALDPGPSTLQFRIEQPLYYVEEDETSGDPLMLHAELPINERDLLVVIVMKQDERGDMRWWFHNLKMVPKDWPQKGRRLFRNRHTALQDAKAYLQNVSGQETAGDYWGEDHGPASERTGYAVEVEDEQAYFERLALNDETPPTAAGPENDPDDGLRRAMSGIYELWSKSRGLDKRAAIEKFVGIAAQVAASVQ